MQSNQTLFLFFSAESTTCSTIGFLGNSWASSILLLAYSQSDRMDFNRQWIPSHRTYDGAHAAAVCSGSNSSEYERMRWSQQTALIEAPPVCRLCPILSRLDRPLRTLRRSAISARHQFINRPQQCCSVWPSYIQSAVAGAFQYVHHAARSDSIFYND